MRTLLAGELTQALSLDSDYHIKLEVQNGSGTWIDLGAALGKNWIVNASWGEAVDTIVSQVTFVLVQQIGTASLSPLMSTSVLNVDDLLAYAPLLNVGRLTRASVATMAHGVALDVSKYRKFHDGRIDDVNQMDAQGVVMSITIVCSDLGAWLMDMQIETSGIQYGTSPTGTALETVLQNVITANIPSGEPAVTLVKQSPATFLVTDWKQGDTKVMEGLSTLVLDSTGEDIRYRYDASHISQLMWFNPDRTRVTVDATITKNRYILRTLNISLRDIRNAGEMPYVGGVASATSPSSIAAFRRRFFRLPSSAMITTLTDAQKVIDAVVNDLSAPPGEAAAECPFLWFVQLYDRYTFQANNRQFDTDQTFAVMGYQHTIENSRGSTTLTLTARIVGAFSSWLTRLDSARTQELGELGNVQWTLVAGVTTVTFERNATTSEVWAAAALASVAQSPDFAPLALAAMPLADGVNSFVVPTPADGQVTLVQLEPRHVDLTIGITRRLIITATPQPPTVELDDLETDTVGTQWWQTTDRGIATTTVEVQTQIGASPITAFGAPSRGPGDPSTVRGGTLGAGTYEHDVTLDASRHSWIVPRLTLANGSMIVLGPFGFDRDKNPNLAGVSVTGSHVLVLGDVDTKAIGLYSTTRAWKWEGDGSFADIDVAGLGTDGSAGLVSGHADTFTVKAWGAPLVYITGGTLVDVRTVLAGNGAGSPSSSWVTVLALAPADGSAVMTVRLKASSAPTPAWSVRIWIDPNGTGFVDRTSALLPVPTAPPTVLTDYTFTTPFVRTTSGPDTHYVVAEVQADLIDDLGVVQAVMTMTASWFST